MRHLPPRPLLSSALVTALVLAVLTALSPTAAQATGRHRAAVGQPQLSGSASGFLFYVLPDFQPLCGSPLGLNASDDPSIDRAACAFTKFQVAGASGTMTTDLYSEDQATPFATGLPVAPTSTAGTYEVDLQPDDTWPAGQVRMVVKDTTGQIGEFQFAVNQLRATLDTGAATAAGDPFTVTGTIKENSARSTATNSGVAAPFTLEVKGSDGSTLWSKDITPASDGTFSQDVPGSATTGITETQTVSVTAVDASYDDTASVPPTGAWAARTAGSATHSVAVAPTGLVLENSFVSSVGWVKPGDTYPSRIIVTNPTDAPVSGASVDLTAAEGSAFSSASGPGTHTVHPASFTWNLPSLGAGDRAVLVLQSTADTTTQMPTIVWHDLSSTAVLHASGQPDSTVPSHGPKVIPPSDAYDTARYGDRPFPVVPLQYTDRSYQDTHSGDSLESVINDPGNPGSTFNLYQEMSLGQLYPEGTVPSKGIASADFTGFDPAFPFTSVTDGTPNTCHGYTYADLGGTANPLYSERITNGVYNLPGDTDYYGDDANGSAVIGAETGQGALQQIDSGCGPTGKVVADAVALADPEIDYSDYDTDKDGVVDFFMGVFAGCGGNGASQLSVAGCSYSDAPYDNIWPHSSSLEYYYTDPATGLPGVVTNDQLKDDEGRPLFWTNDSYTEMTTTDTGKKVFVRVGPYNLNPETAIDKASVISHEYGHSLGLPDFYSTGSRETYGDWNLMANDKSQNMDAFSRQELGWVVPEVLTGNRTVNGWKDSKEDTGTIHWQTEDGTPYTLTDGVDGTVHNSQMYVAKLPGRQLLDASAFTPSDTSEGASPSHLWWSGSGNDFGCTPSGGRNFDLAIPGAASLPAGSTINLSFKSRWDTEWDFDYGFVMTTVDGGQTYTSHASDNDYTTPASTNPNTNACQAQYGNGLTGSSGSYQAGTETTDRAGLTDSPPPVFLSDSYDISDLVGQADGALRFSYATDPGVARPGWFIDDVKVTATLPGGGTQDLYVTDFESNGGPDDPAVYNGGCRGDLSTAQLCTIGWKYLEAGAEAPQDHAYYLEMRDRSGFDDDGHGEIDRDPIGFGAGLYLAYTDESHGYGNFGTDDPPAQSPVDSVPEPGSETPNLNDAAFTADSGRSSYSDSGAGHIDNYTDPSSASGNWEFKYNCLGFDVLSMSGQGVGPETSDGDLTGDVQFTMGPDCGTFDYGYGEGTTPGDNTDPTAAASASPTTAKIGQQVTFDATDSTDAETPDTLDYSWDFGDGSGKQAGAVARHRFASGGTYTATVTVTDVAGGTDTDTVDVTVVDKNAPKAAFTVKPTHPYAHGRTTLDGKKSSDETTAGKDLTYVWNFGDGGTRVDAMGRRTRLRFNQPGSHTVKLTVTDEAGNSSTVKKKVRVRRFVSCSSGRVDRNGSWQTVTGARSPFGDYCDTNGRGRGKDTVTMPFRGQSLVVVHGARRGGGTAAVFVDGERQGELSFRSKRRTIAFERTERYTGLGAGPHTLRIVMLRGTGYLSGFVPKG